MAMVAGVRVKILLTMATVVRSQVKDTGNPGNGCSGEGESTSCIVLEIEIRLG